ARLAPALARWSPDARLSRLVDVLVHGEAGIARGPVEEAWLLHVRDAPKLVARRAAESREALSPDAQMVVACGPDVLDVWKARWTSRVGDAAWIRLQLQMIKD